MEMGQCDSLVFELHSKSVILSGDKGTNCCVALQVIEKKDQCESGCMYDYKGQKWAF
jgi:hypothetical protein